MVASLTRTPGRNRNDLNSGLPDLDPVLFSVDQDPDPTFKNEFMN